MTAWKPPICVFKYRGWCAICRLCDIAVAVDRPTQQVAMWTGLMHLAEVHDVRGPVGRRHNA